MSSHQIILYESPASRSDRVKFLLEEIKIPYNKKTISIPKKEYKSEDFLKINPNGTVPFLIDNETGIHISESGAICNYLARKYKDRLYFPDKNLKEIAQYEEMMYFAVSTLDPVCFQILFHSKWYPEEKRIPSIVEENVRKFVFCADFLNRNLAKNKFVLGDKISTPDFIIAPSLLCIKEEVKKHSLIQEYVMNILSLTSMKKVRHDVKIFNS
ncbi:glutathione S-transferase family protein [Silvanigrella paludirubra]|uniref:glutathione S-transferase family protein n=1 Tax=Silvanigrella paludirubra TaxID=2499159 RepID=UPI001386B9A7|nr:glutathione S-transferase family protein [Silvanigrella paludirubra]